LNFRAQSRWVYFLPALHVSVSGVCLLTFVIPPHFSFLAIVWEFILFADLPLSAIAMGIGMVNGGIAAAWILVVGTLWWYLLSLGFAAIYRHFKYRNERFSITK
jgi:hypothetical protein